MRARLDYVGLEAIFSFVLSGQEMNRTGLDGAEQFLPKRSMGYAIDGSKLLLFPQPGLPAMVLKRIG